MARSLDLAKVRGDQAKEAGDFVQTQGRRNLIINGGFDVWQRGTSFTGSGYTADRWRLSSNVSASLTTERTGIGLKCTQDPGFLTVLQGVEFNDRFYGKTVTLSFEAITSHPIFITARLQNSSVGTPAGAGEFSDTIISDELTESLGNNRYKLTFNIPAAASGTPAALGIEIRPDAINQQATSIELGTVQLELGDTATPFEQRSYGEELALCQRYYETGESSEHYMYVGATTADPIEHIFLTEKRIAPAMSTFDINATVNVDGVRILKTHTNHFASSTNGHRTVPEPAVYRVYFNWEADAEL